MYPRCKSLGLIEADPPGSPRAGNRPYPRCKSLGLIEADGKGVRDVADELGVSEV